MNTIKIDGIEVPVEKLEALGFKRVVEGVWPEDGDIYYYLDGEGGLCSNRFFIGRECDKHNLFIGNFFRTYQEVIDYKEKTYATQRVLKKLRELEGGYEVNLGEVADNYIPIYRLETESLFAYWAIFTQHFVPTEWYSPKEAWEWVIENMESDLLLAMGIEK